MWCDVTPCTEEAAHAQHSSRGPPEGGPSPHAMIGRDAELRKLRGLLADTADGRGGALLIHGPAGLGKSALLRAVGAEGTEDGFKVLSAACVETELWLPFAALQLLLQPAADGIRKLPF